MKPAYQRARERDRTVKLIHFLNEMVIPDDFDSLDLDAVEGHLNMSPDTNITAFCEWFNLGEWFIDEMTQDEFNLDAFLVELRSRIECEEREAEEDDCDRRRDYKEAVGIR